MINIKYRNESKAVLIEIDIVHIRINEVAIFEDVKAAQLFCLMTYGLGVGNWISRNERIFSYIDETRRLEIRSVREVSEF